MPVGDGAGNSWETLMSSHQHHPGLPILNLRARVASHRISARWVDTGHGASRASGQFPSLPSCGPPRRRRATRGRTVRRDGAPRAR